MKVKTFILSLFLTMFCSTSFGQHWGEIPNHYEGNMTFVTQIFIDDVLQGEDIEIGAFCGNEFRGSARPIASQSNMVYLLIEGDGDHNGDQISFKLARHYANAPSEELDYVIFNALTYEHNARIGASPADLVNGLLPEDDRDRTEFNSVASLNGEVYPSLANALAACTTGNNTIELLKDNAEDVTIKQVEGVNITIDGGTSRFDYSGTITIHGNARYYGAETLTFKNIDFVTSEASHYFIDSNSTDSDERYAHNVTVDDCNFTATDAGVNSAVAMRIRQGFDIAINGGTFTGLHSVLQAYGNAGINITGITSNCKNGISAGTSTGVVIENSNITATGYGLRADGTGAYDMTLKGANSITAELPVVVRNTTGAYKLTVESGTYTALNGNPAVTFTTGDDGTFVAPTADATATIADGVNVTTFGLEAKIANDYYTIVANAATAASNETGDQTIVLIKDATSTVNPLNVEILDLNAKTLTANVIGKVKTNGGLWITPENFKMIGVGADYYTTDNATIVMGANYALRMTEGTVTLAQSWRTLPGQTVAIESYAKFIVPAGMTYQIYGTAVAAAGTLEVNGTVQLAQLDATLTAEAGLNVVSGVDGYVVKYENGVYKLVAGNVLNVNTGAKYAKIADAVVAAAAGDSLVLLEDITENVTIDKNVKINGAGKTYTGNMTLKNRADITIKNVNFDGKGYNGYAIEARGAYYITIEDCTAKNYGYGFVQLASGTVLTTVKNVTVSDMNYGVKVDYSNAVVLENLNLDCAVAAVLNSNYGEKTITIKNSYLSILGTWTRNNTIKTTYVFEGANSIDEFVIDAAIDNFKLADVNSTLTAPNNITVTTDVENSIVVYENGMYKVKPAVASITADDNTTTYYETLADAVEAATAGQTVNLLADATGAGLKINKDVTINFGGKTYIINQAVGSTGTESQGFQLLKNNTVTLKNGNIAIAEGTNVKWMFNAYADVTLENLNVNCANMAAPAENEANYVLVVNNGGDATPTVTYTNVTVTNFPTATAQIWLDPTTTLKAGEGLESSIETGEGYVVVYNNGEYTAVPAVASITADGTPTTYYETLAGAVEAATAGQTVNLLADATGAGLKINKDVTINFGGKTYTINQAVGSTGTESQGFQLLKNNTVTLKNGTIAIAENTNVKWMFNAYADVTLENLNVNCANMAAPAENEANYVLVVNNGGDATPTVTYTNVIVTNFPSTATAPQIWLDPTTTLKADEGLESSIETEEGYVVVYNNGEYTAIAGNVLNANTGAKYAKIVDAVTAATAGDTLVLLADITEDVTVNKNLTIDGKAADATANSEYTGTMTVNTSLTVTVQNVNFVKGSIAEAEGSRGILTVKGCNFDGVDKSIGYAVTVRGGDKLTIENTTAMNYSTGMLYIPRSVVNIAIKDVEVSNVAAAFNISYSGDGTFENVEVDNVTYGIHFQIYGSRTYTVKNCDLKGATNPFWFWDKSNNTAKVTVVFEGNNDLGTKGITVNAGELQLATDATLTAAEGLDIKATEEGYVVEYNEGVYSVVAGNILNQTTDKKYAKLQAAIDEASANDVIVLLADITENVTVNKNLTIDGKAEGATANSKYTGTMTVNTSLTVTVQNVNFVKGSIAEAEGPRGNLTVKGCNFDGVDKSIGYAVTVRGGDKLTIENSTAMNYGTGMLYIPRSVVNIAIKDVEVSNVAAAFNITYSGDGTFENVKVDNVTYGIHFQIYGSRTYTVKNCDLKGATNPFWFWDKSNNTAKVTVVFEGNNDLGTKGITVNAGELQLATDATLTAAEGLSIKATEEGYVVEYNEGVYSVVPGNIALERNGEIVKKFATIQDAINAAVDNDVVVVLADIEVNIDNVEGLPTVDGHPTYYEVTGKTISIDLNGMTIKANVTATDLLLGLFSTEQNGNLTFIDSSNGSGTVEVVASDDANVYALITNYEETSSITINNGNYRLNKTGINGQSLIYDSPGNMVINGGNFHLGNIGTDGVNNGLPWIFNCYGKDQGNVTVKGGTFNADVNHQHWAHEVYVPNTLALKDNGNGTWTVVDAVAQGTDSWRGYNRSLGYASIADAAHWAKAETTVTVVADHAITVPAVVERNLTLDMNAKAVTAQYIYPVIRIQNDANVTVKNGNITNNDYVFVLGASDGSSAGNLTIESGVYTGTTTVASVTKGLLTINGGEFKVNDSEYGATYMINCIDANYNDDSANVEIYGGKFYGFNPENNAAEGANTNFCAQGYGAVENSTDVWTVVPKQTAEVKDGWNWFSYYVEGDVLGQLKNSLGTVGVQIKSRTQFTQYSNDGSWNGDLVSTTPAESYKINVDADAVINVTGNIVDPSTCYIMLNNGGNNVGAWNWIGYPLAQETSVETAFAGVVKNGDQVKTRTGFAEYVSVNGQWWGNLRTLEPGVGYMYFRAGDNVTVSDFTYPTPSSKEAVQPNITADANLWVPNSTSYANNMTMVAVLNMNGEMMNDNYEVAAMVNGEVRGSARPIYVEPMDAYMLFLTIHGEGVEEVTFQCYDFNTDTEYVLNNTINYSDDARLGSVNEPYVLCYGTMGIGENAMNTINIYPNPTTTDREINLQATCDKVEVFNALGVKVAEYHNVDTLDAIETAGIYVIRVTNDGDVKHCRLVVK